MPPRRSLPVSIGVILRFGAAAGALAWAGSAAAQVLPEDQLPTNDEPGFVQPAPSGDDDDQPCVPVPPPIEDIDPYVPPAPDPTLAEDRVAFEANGVTYDSNGQTVRADGNVILRDNRRALRANSIQWNQATGDVIADGDVFVSNDEDRSVRADQVVWDRSTGEIVATGNIRFVDEAGNQLYTSRIVLDDSFEAGQIEEVLIALREGGRLAAEGGRRTEDGRIQLETAAYSACAVTNPAGCPKDPSWRITADRVTYDPEAERVSFDGAYLELFGKRLLPLPGLAIRTDGGPESGLLVPDLRISQSNGVEVIGSYYWRLGQNRDLTTSAYVFTEAPPMVSAQYRQLTSEGAFQITGYGTYSRRISDVTGQAVSEQDPRGYLFANGKYQFSPEWSATGSVRVASDRTFLRRYDISRDDRLRSTVNIERIDEDTYLSFAGWATQTLRLGQPQGQVPQVLPVIDFRHRMRDLAGLGDVLEFQANTLALFRDDGQDTQRAIAKAQWDLKQVTGLGQVITLTGLARGDLYHSTENALTQTALYRGEPGWQGRAIALGAVDVQWPLVGEAFGGTQVLTPRFQIVAVPGIRNLEVPNEDSRAIDLEDTNLFALNRFPGYDRVEPGVRAVYGVDWSLQRPGMRINASLGQSYRLIDKNELLPDGTGLSDQFSDYVGRTKVRFRNFVSFTHRYRLDKDDFAVRRNEIDATVGTRRTYAEVGYLRLNRDIDELEDLQDREEVRFAARLAFANYWSVFGSGVVNLTDREEDPTFTSDGFQPIRTRLGVAYEDDCLEMGLTWRRDYIDTGDAQRGNTFEVFFALKNLGFR
ncbi:LPS assembly protein LptD [Qipengyuania sp. JC766]|uniref:LPS-assembly protein LptD n=1 Tax=Qipengyuania sp. JC766 TaxID=3232139 RepID=UPI00345AFA15